MRSRKEPGFNHIQGLSLPLGLIKGVGPKRAELLAHKGLNTILDLFYFTPIRYENRSIISPIRQIEDGTSCLVRVTVIEGKEERFYPSKKRVYRITVSDDEGERLELLWFHYIKPHLAGFSRPGISISAYGTMKISRGKRQMFHPDMAIAGAKADPGFIPVYSSVKGISANTLRALIRTSMDNYLKDIIDPIPAGILNRLQLPGLADAIKGVHFPARDSDPELLDQSETSFHSRLLFDRFFSIMMVIAFKKKIKEGISKPVWIIPSGLEEAIKKFFKFRLTNDQGQAVRDIARDLENGHPMNRLLMGDVGTGKTAVAALASYIAVRNNRQVALMTPTQILAEQHMNYFSNLPEVMGFHPVLIAGELKKGDRERIYKAIREKAYNIIIGTQSLIQDALVFGDLGLAVIDEQHRFGVRQRAIMDRKGDNPHILIMTATPIPRSLAIAVYGDMDISTLNEYPEGHRTVKTTLVHKHQKRWVFERVTDCISKGRQAFVICPVIEETEESDLKGAQEMYERLKKILSPSYRIGLVHGRMKSDEKDPIMQGFHKGDVDILVATTVVEVGVHVPNATLMVIEHPDRFGLAQLHQLRGRVGRGDHEGMCLLILPDNISDRAEARLKALAECHDGFKIAQKDLEFRGHGELTGLRQAGAGEIEPLEIIRYKDLIIEAKRLAQDLIKSDPDLSHPDHKYLLKMMTDINAGRYHDL